MQMYDAYVRTCKRSFYPTDHKGGQENFYFTYIDLFNYFNQNESNSFTEKSSPACL